jgi:superfamily II DNA helicase RecQ
MNAIVPVNGVGVLSRLSNYCDAGTSLFIRSHICAFSLGHDFRPDYAKLGVLKGHFPTIPVLAVTATASDRVREDCCAILRLSVNYRFFRSTADRPNLRYQVRPKESAADTLDDMTAFIKDHHPNSAGIIYTYSRKDANTVADQLLERGIIGEAYHSEYVRRLGENCGCDKPCSCLLTWILTFSLV